MPPRMDPAAAASLMLRTFDELSPFIEMHTARVCPHCPKVCCANKHGLPEKEDLIFFSAAGLQPEPSAGPPDEICSLLAARGCLLPRARRPFRCTWYFCAPLLESMRAGNARDYRRFVDALDRLVKLRERLLRCSAC